MMQRKVRCNYCKYQKISCYDSRYNVTEVNGCDFRYGVLTDYFCESNFDSLTNEINGDDCPWFEKGDNRWF